MHVLGQIQETPLHLILFGISIFTHICPTTIRLLKSKCHQCGGMVSPNPLFIEELSPHPLRCGGHLQLQHHTSQNQQSSGWIAFLLFSSLLTFPQRLSSKIMKNTGGGARQPLTISVTLDGWPASLSITSLLYKWEQYCSLHRAACVRTAQADPRGVGKGPDA